MSEVQSTDLPVYLIPSAFTFPDSGRFKENHHVKISILTLIASAGLFASAEAQTGALRWHDSLKDGAAQARQSAKPLFVVFRCVR